MIYVILGRREQGKTTLGLYVTRKHSARVLFDPRALMPTTDRITKEDDIRPAFEELRDAQPAAADVTLTPGGRVQPFFERTSAQVKRWIQSGGPPIAYLVDELRFVNPNTDDFDWLCRCATRAEIAIVVTAHRPADVPTDLRAIADVWCVFHTTQEHDLDAIEERTSSHFRAQVARLQPRFFLTWDDTKGRMLGPSTVPASEITALASSRVAISDDLGLPDAARVDNPGLFK